MDARRQRLIAENEALFRTVNERISAIQDDDELDLRTLLIVCECGDGQCSDTVRIAVEAYRAVRMAPDQFVVLRGHEIREVEAVVEEGEYHLVVEKLGEAARHLSEG